MEDTTNPDQPIERFSTNFDGILILGELIRWDDCSTHEAILNSVYRLLLRPDMTPSIARTFISIAQSTIIHQTTQ